MTVVSVGVIRLVLVHIVVRARVRVLAFCLVLVPVISCIVLVLVAVRVIFHVLAIFLVLVLYLLIVGVFFYLFLLLFLVLTSIYQAAEKVGEGDEEVEGLFQGEFKLHASQPFTPLAAAVFCGNSVIVNAVFEAYGHPGLAQEEVGYGLT